MPDLRLNPVATEPKTRNLVDQSTPDLSGSQFLDTMLSSVSTALADEPSYLERSKQLEAVSAKTAAPPVDKKSEIKTGGIKPAPSDATSDIKAKIKARLKEMAAKDSSPVKDTKPLKALQKVAKFLVQASEDGKIDLPPEMVQKLQDFLAKGDDLKAFDIANFMTDFADTFRSVTVNLNAQTLPAADGEALKWPDDVLDSFKEMDLAGVVATGDKPLDTMGALRAVKSLVSESQKAAIKTLDENSQAGLSAQDPASILLAGLKNPAAPLDATADAAQPSIVSDAVKTSSPEEVAAALVAAPVVATVASIKKDMQAALLALNELPETPLDTKVVEQLQQAKPPVAPVAAPISAAAPQISLTKLAGETTLPQADAGVKTVSVKTDDVKLGAVEKPVAEIVLKDVPQIASTANAQPQQVEQIILPTQAAAAPAPHDAKVAEPVISSIAGIDASAVAANLTGAKAVMQSAAVQTLSNSLSGAAAGSPMQQVVVHLQSKMNKSSQISIQMTPAELGQVEIRLETSSDGKTRAVVMAEKPETLALLQKDATQLERALNQAGLNADTKNMSFNLRDQNNAQQFNQQGRKRFSREAFNEKSGMEIAIPVTGAGQIFSDTQINYHA